MVKEMEIKNLKEMEIKNLKEMVMPNLMEMGMENLKGRVMVIPMVKETAKLGTIYIINPLHYMDKWDKVDMSSRTLDLLRKLDLHLNLYKVQL